MTTDAMLLTNQTAKLIEYPEVILISSHKSLLNHQQFKLIISNIGNATKQRVL